MWTEELIRWLWVWMACLGLSEAERYQQHLRMDMVRAEIAKQDSPEA